VSYARPRLKRKRNGYMWGNTKSGDHNVEGILAALRYLSLEAEGAGLIELANTLEDAALQCDRYIAHHSKDRLRT